MEKPWHDTFGRQVFNQTKPTVFRNNDSLITLSFIAESSMAFIYKPDGDLNKLGNTVPPASLQPARWEVHTLVISGGFNTHFQHNPKAVQTSVCVRVCVLRRQQLHVSDVSAEFGTQRGKKTLWAWTQRIHKTASVTLRTNSTALRRALPHLPLFAPRGVCLQGDTQSTRTNCTNSISSSHRTQKPKGDSHKLCSPPLSLSPSLPQTHTCTHVQACTRFLCMHPRLPPSPPTSLS